MITARGILVLGVLTLVALTLALFIARPSGSPEAPVSEPLVPGLYEIVNEVSAIDVIGPDGETVVSLRRERERWRVSERDGFEANFERVHDLLRDLASGRRASPRTENPDWYGRLGVIEPGQPDASGMLVRFPDSGLPSLIVGRPDSAGQGHFVRLENERQSWISDRTLDVPARLTAWLERSVMDIPARELSEVTIRHPDGDTVNLRAADEDGELWVLMNVPDERDAVEGWRLRPVAGGLSSVSLEDVRPAGSIPDEAVRALYRTRDGLNFLASLFEDEGGHWVHFRVSAELAAVSEDEQLERSEEDLLIDAAAVDDRLSAWHYRISSRKFETMTRRLDDLLRPAD
jgi:hypothetical protein